MFDSLYPEAADAAIEAKANRAPDPVAPTPWFKGGWSAVGKALPRAGAEMARALTAPMTPEAAAALSSPSMFGAPQTTPSQATSELRQQDSAIRDAIKEMTPDANSTGAAAMILHDVTRFVGKAAAYSLAGGAAGAVVGMGLDEGINETLRRTDEGVDPTTAAKLGAVKGVSSAVAVALPVAGRTIGQTLALAAGGGPGSFIAEQITAREILANADYTKEAAEIDPFDPLGLGVSFFGSLIFGAGALGARRMRAKADAKVADAQMMAAEVPPGQPTEVARAARAVTQEQVDAAHVSELQTHRETSGLHAPEDVAARAEHARALDEATTQLATGQRVSVAEVAPVDAARIEAEVMPAVERATAAVRALEAEVQGLSLTAQRLQALPGLREISAEDARTLLQGKTEKPGGVDPAQQIDVSDGNGKRMLLGAVPLEQIRANEEGARYDSTVDLARARDYASRPADSAPPVILTVSPRTGALNVLDGGHRVSAARMRGDTTIPAVVLARQEPGASVEAQPAKPPEAPTGDPVADAITTAARAIEDAASGKPAGSTPDPAAQPAAGADTPSADFVAREADTIAATDPDMMVMMEGMDQPVKASELLAEAKAMAEQEIADAPLMRVAAECALRG